MAIVAKPEAPISLAVVNDKVQTYLDTFVAEPVIISIGDIQAWISTSQFNPTPGSVGGVSPTTTPQILVPVDADTPRGVDLYYTGSGNASLPPGQVTSPATFFTVLDQNGDELTDVSGNTITVIAVRSVQGGRASPDPATGAVTGWHGTGAFGGPVLEFNAQWDDFATSGVTGVQIIAGYQRSIDSLFGNPASFLRTTKLTQQVDADVRTAIATLMQTDTLAGAPIDPGAWDATPPDGLTGLSNRMLVAESDISDLLAATGGAQLAVLVDGSRDMTGVLRIQKTGGVFAIIKRATVAEQDRVIEWVDEADARQGYVGRVEGGGTPGMWIQNTVSAQNLKLLDASGLTFDGAVVPVADGAVQTNLNADKVDGVHSSGLFILVPTAGITQTATLGDATTGADDGGRLLISTGGLELSGMLQNMTTWDISLKFSRAVDTAMWFTPFTASRGMLIGRTADNAIRIMETDGAAVLNSSSFTFDVYDRIAAVDRHPLGWIACSGHVTGTGTAAGTPSVKSQNIIYKGTAAFGTDNKFQIRWNSGSSWFELQVPDGSTVADFHFVYAETNGIVSTLEAVQVIRWSSTEWHFSVSDSAGSDLVGRDIFFCVIGSKARDIPAGDIVISTT